MFNTHQARPTQNKETKLLDQGPTNMDWIKYEVDKYKYTDRPVTAVLDIKLVSRTGSNLVTKTAPGIDR